MHLFWQCEHGECARRDRRPCPQGVGSLCPLYVVVLWHAVVLLLILLTCTQPTAQGRRARRLREEEERSICEELERREEEDPQKRGKRTIWDYDSVLSACIHSLYYLVFLEEQKRLRKQEAVKKEMARMNELRECEAREQQQERAPPPSGGLGSSGSSGCKMFRPLDLSLIHI